MRTYKNLFALEVRKPILEEYIIGYTKVYIYPLMDDETPFSKCIALLFKLVMYGDYALFWFANFEEMYEKLGIFLELEEDFYQRIIVIVDKI